jgi:hypothetical protein
MMHDIYIYIIILYILSIYIIYIYIYISNIIKHFKFCSFRVLLSTAGLCTLVHRLETDFRFHSNSACSRVFSGVAYTQWDLEANCSGWCFDNASLVNAEASAIGSAIGSSWSSMGSWTSHPWSVASSIFQHPLLKSSDLIFGLIRGDVFFVVS